MISVKCLEYPRHPTNKKKIPNIVKTIMNWHDIQNATFLIWVWILISDTKRRDINTIGITSESFEQ